MSKHKQPEPPNELVRETMDALTSKEGRGQSREPDFVPEAPAPEGKEPVEHKVGDRVKVHDRHTVHAGVRGKVVSVDPRHGMACVDDGRDKVREWFRHEELEKAE